MRATHELGLSLQPLVSRYITDCGLERTFSNGLEFNAEYIDHDIVFTYGFRLLVSSEAVPTDDTFQVIVSSLRLSIHFDIQ